MSKKFLTILIFFAVFCFANYASAAVVPSDADLLNWRFDPQPLTPIVSGGTAFGNVVYDPVNEIWRFFYHNNANNGTGTIYQQTGSTPRFFESPVLVLGHGGSSAWDEKDTGVPYVWYETGETRPWRMIYRGCPVSGGCQIGLATSTDGVTWERKDTQGNSLTNPVLTYGASGWDANQHIDFGAIMKVGSTYYLFYNTIGDPRQIGLATSTDLITWTKDANNPLYIAVPGYQDSTTEAGKDENGETDSTAGFFCADILRWDREDGSTRYVMISPHYMTGSTTPSYDLYVSDDPHFYQSQRTYIGKILRSDGAYAAKINGQNLASSGMDTPRIITDDITRNVTTSTLTGDDVLLVASVYNSGLNWNHAMMVYNKSLSGSTLSSVYADLPNSSPAFSLSPAGSDSNTAALWLPGVKESLRELSGTGINLSGKYTNIDSNGVRLTASNSEFVQFAKTGVSGATEFSTNNIQGVNLNSITGDFTLEAKVMPQTMASFTSGYRTILAYTDTLGAPYHFYWLIQYFAGPIYKMVLIVTDSGSVNRTYTSPAITLTDGVATRLTLTRSGSTVRAFQDGVSLDAGQTFNYTIKSDTNPSLYIGMGYNGSSYPWDGYIDEIRISNIARWTSSYTPSALTYTYPSSGTIFTKVYNFGSANQPAYLTPTTTTPTGTSVQVKVRSASSSTDQSTTIGDFSALPQQGITSQYQQFAIAFATTDTSVTPTVSLASIENVAIPALTETTPISTYTNDSTPTYVFSSSKAGTISYAGGCSSATTSATAGSNTITFNSLDDGTYSNCTITVTDSYGYVSSALSVSGFTVDTATPTLTESTSITTPACNLAPSYVFSTTEAGTISYSGDCSSSTTSATSGSNTITLNQLSAGIYSNCKLKITDSAGNVSSWLTISPFTISCGGGVPLFILQQMNQSQQQNQQPPPSVPTSVPFEQMSKDQKIEYLTKQIADLMQQVKAMQQSTQSANYIFTKDLKMGDTDPEVKLLQQYLNNHEFVLSVSGPGSPGNETTKFGLLTKQALIKLQKANGIKSTGNFGPITRGWINKNN